MCLSSQTNAHIRRVGGMSSVFFVLLPTQHDACCISWDHQDFNDLNYISLSFSSLCTVYIFVLWPFSFLILLFGHYSYIPLFLAIINLNTNGLSEKKKTTIIWWDRSYFFPVPPGKAHLQERNKPDGRKENLYLGCSVICHFQYFSSNRPRGKNVWACGPSSDCCLRTFPKTPYCPLYELRIHITIVTAF